MIETPPIPSRSLKLFAGAVQWALWLLLAAWLLLALVWGSLHAFIVPRVGELRPALERQASRALGIPVRIGSISARTEGLVPSFELQDVALLDPQGRTALQLPLVVAALSPRSLWHLGFEQLYIHRPELDIRRAADGRLFVAGLDMSRPGGGDEGRAADWLFRQTEFVLRGGTLRWTDELRGAPPLALTDVDLVVRNQARRHAVRLDAAPPPAWGGRFTLMGVFREPLLASRPGRWQDWQGQMHADFDTVDLAQLRRHLPLDVSVAHGSGRLRAWADLQRGQITGGVVDVVLTDVQATLAPALAALELTSVSGRLGGRRLQGGFQFETQGLRFVTRDGQRWPGGNVALTWTQPEAKAPARGELRADRLDLGALRAIATRLPLGTATLATLQAYAPGGVVDSIQARWEGPAGAPDRYEARGRVTGLELASQPGPEGHAGVPGLRGADVEFDLTQAGGKARVALQRGSLSFPGVFEEPDIRFDQLAADLSWQAQGPQLAVQVASLRFANADVQGEATGNWRTADASGPSGSRFPGVLDLQGSLSRANGARVWRYLPLGVGRAARQYVRDAVLAGTASGVRFRVRGDLWHFPFADNRAGEFQVTAQVRDVTFAYVPRSLQTESPAWPALTQLAGELVFKGPGMAVRGATGQVVGAPRLQLRADAQIADFSQSQVRVQARVRGPLAESLGYVNASPVGGMLGQSLARATGTGAADVDLQLALPLATMERSQVQGTVTLAGNDLQVMPDTPALGRVRGAVVFTERGFQLAGVQARALGGDVRLDGGTRPGEPGEPPAVLLRAQGIATAEGLRQARELGFVARLARDFSGSTPYGLTLGIRRGHPEVLVTSNLQGLALQLPAPLGKPAEAALPLRYENALTREAVQGGRPQDTLAVDLGRLASVSYLRDVSGAQPQVVRGSIAVGLAPGETVAPPEDGVAANVQLSTFNVDAWREVLARASGEAPGPAQAAPAAASAPTLAGAAPAPPSDANVVQGYLPTVLAVRARELSAEGRTLHNVVVGGSREGRVWRANVDADEMSGYVEYRQPQATGAGRVFARLARLGIADAEASQVEALLEQQPGSIPALDIVVDAFELKGRRLGRLEIDAVNRGAGAVMREGGIREWRLNRLSLSNPDATFSASGNWAALQPTPGAARPGAADRRRTAMRFRLEIADAGQLLGRLGMRDVVRRGRGTMEGHVAWLGSPMALDYPSMAGTFNVNLESGQFLKADPGLAKLLGVLSLQSLPRRLVLDFRDVFSEGFAFDFVRGDIVIEQGIAASNNLQMKGVNAAVLMEGRADLARETQDLKVVVVPEINAGTASLVATVINPAIGLGSFLAQMFLRQPLMQAATQEFRVDGTWSDPRVTRVARGQAAEAGRAPASATAPPADNAPR